MESANLAMFGIWELVIILLIVMVIFGAGKLPMLGEGLGKAIRNFRRTTKDVVDSANQLENAAAAAPQALLASEVEPISTGVVAEAESTLSEGP